ncbi:MAG TPA: DUF5362 family protein, partial [Chitinophagaceae bacterium]|nr:DUF5362 family protein [Chitinophagaceae bacterium]
GMVLLGLALVFSILTETVLSNMDGIFTVNNQESELGSAFAVSYAIGMILFFVIGFFPLLFLLHFANRLRAALAGNAQEDLTVAFQNLKKYFRYVGIILIIVLVIYGLAFVLALLGSAAA